MFRARVVCVLLSSCLLLLSFGTWSDTTDRQLLTVYLLDVSTSMVGVCGGDGCEEQETYLSDAVDILHTLLKQSDGGSTLVMMFGKGIHDFDGHPRNPAAPGPIQVDPIRDGPIKTEYLLEEAGEGSEDLRDDLLRFLKPDGKAYVSSEFSHMNKRESDWRGVAEEVRAAAERSRDTTYLRSGPPWAGYSTALFGSIRDAIDRVRGLGGARIVHVNILTDSQRVATQDYAERRDIEEAIKRLCTLPQTGELDFRVTQFYWGTGRPADLLDATEDYGSCHVVETDPPDMRNGYIMIFWDRGILPGEQETNLWFDRHVDLGELEARRVLQVKYNPPPRPRERDPSATLDADLEVTLSPGGLPWDLTAGSEIIVGPIEGGLAQELALNVDQVMVRETIHRQGTVEGVLTSSVGFTPTRIPPDVGIVVIHPVTLLLPYEIPNLTVLSWRDADAIVIELIPNGAFSDPRNPPDQRLVEIVFNASLFDLFVDGEKNSTNIVRADAGPVLRLVPRVEANAPGEYEGRILVRAIGEGLVDGDTEFSVPYRLHVVGFAKSSLVPDNLWRPDPSDPLVSRDRLSVHGIDWQELAVVVDPVGFGIPGVDVTVALEEPVQGGADGECVVRLAFTPADRLADEKELLNSRNPDGHLEFSVKQSGDADRLVAFKQRELPVDLRYEELLIGLTVTNRIPDACVPFSELPREEARPEGEWAIRIAFDPAPEIDGDSRPVLLQHTRHTRANEDHLELAPQYGTQDKIPPAGTKLSVEEVAILYPQPRGGKCDEPPCYEGELIVTPISNDVWFELSSGELTQRFTTSYSYCLQDRPIFVRIRNESIEFHNPWFTSCEEGNSGSMQPLELVLPSPEDDPREGEIRLEAVGVVPAELADGVHVDMVVRPPFDGVKGTIPLEVDPSILLEAQRLGEPRITGNVRFRYVGPEPVVLVNENLIPIAEVPFSVDVSPPELQILFNPELESQVCGKRGNREARMWKRGETIGSLSLSRGADTGCLPAGSEVVCVSVSGCASGESPLALRRGGETEPIPCDGVSVDGLRVALPVGESFDQLRWDVVVDENARLGQTHPELRLRIESADPAALRLTAEDDVECKLAIHVRWPLMEALHGFAGILRWIALAPFFLGLLAVLVVSAKDRFMGNPPWDVVYGFYSTPKNRWARFATIILVLIFVVAIVARSVLSRWTC